MSDKKRIRLDKNNYQSFISDWQKGNNLTSIGVYHISHICENDLINYAYTKMILIEIKAMKGTAYKEVTFIEELEEYKL